MINIAKAWKNLFEPSQEERQNRFDTLYNSMHSNGNLIHPASFLQRAAHKFPNQTALLYKDEEITYGDLYKKAVGLSEKLQQLGIKADDRICLFFENSIDYYIAYYGIWQLNAVIVPLNTFFSEKELEHVINDCNPALIITSHELLPKIDTLAQKQKIPLLTEQDFPGASNRELTISAADPNKMVALLYTSGTTGFAKGVMLSSQNILYNIAQSVCNAQIYNTDRLFGVLPLFHSFAQLTCVWANFFLGVITIVVPKIERRWILDGLHKKPTFMVGVPAFYGLLCLMKNAPLDTVRYFASGGDALPDKIRSAFQLIYRRKICNGYGLTETSPFVAVAIDDRLVSSEVVGPLALGLQAQLINEEGAIIDNKSIGILRLKGNNIMLGYYNAPEATQNVLSADGWLDTGDFATFDDKNRLLICGRFKDLIIHKGFNIYPQEIENVIMTHPLVMHVGVVGKPDPDSGEIPIAFVMAREKKDNLEQELKNLCNNNLALYKVPKQFIILKELPLTATGKVNKKVLKKEHFV